jgi:RNA polymerase sigma-70 factor (sigma-E family)
MKAELEREYVEYVRARLPVLRRVAYQLAGDADRGDDVVQQAVTRLYTRWRRAREAHNLDAYVHTLLVRVFLDEKRLGWSRVRLVDAVPDRPAAPPPDSEDRAVLRAALARVPPRQRAVLVLRFLADRPVDEVARILGCTPGTVKSQTSHGLAALRRLLGDRAYSISGEECDDGTPAGAVAR